MDTVGILVCYNGSWVRKDNIDSYEGGEAKGIIVSRNITFPDLVQRIYKIMDADPNKYIVTPKYSVPISSSVYKHIRVEHNDDVQYFLKYNIEVMASKVTPLIASLKNIEGHGIEGWNGNVSIESSNAPTKFDVNFKSVENIVVDLCEPSNEEEPYSAPNMHRHGDNNFEPSIVQRRQVQSEPSRQSISTGMQTSWIDLMHGHSLKQIDYGGGLCCINWEANFKVGRVFPKNVSLLKTISLAAIRGHFRLRTVQSGKRQLCVRCWQLSCRWQVREYKVGLHEFRVFKYDPFHECDLRYVTSHHPQATTGLLFDSVNWRLKDSRTIYTPVDIKKDVKTNFGVTISYATAWRSRELAFKTIRSCTCRKFDLEQLPCKHAIAVCRHLKLNPDSLASSYYTRATWAAAYAKSIYPVPPQGTWVIPEHLNNIKILPPLSKVMAGRHKTQRIPSKGEDRRENKCSRCGVKGHYRNTCKQSVPVTNKQQVV
ncbi:unnamed protein product [Prunus armeniaca]